MPAHREFGDATLVHKNLRADFREASVMASSEQHRRVVITGVGLHTPMGDSLDDIEARYRSGASAVRHRPDTGGNGTRAAAFLDGDAAQGFPGALAKMTDRSTLIALRASDAVMSDAALRRGEYDPARI